MLPIIICHHPNLIMGSNLMEMCLHVSSKPLRLINTNVDDATSILRISDEKQAIDIYLGIKNRLWKCYFFGG